MRIQNPDVLVFSSIEAYRIYARGRRGEPAPTPCSVLKTPLVPGANVPTAATPYSKPFLSVFDTAPEPSLLMIPLACLNNQVFSGPRQFGQNRRFKCLAFYGIVWIEPLEILFSCWCFHPSGQSVSSSNTDCLRISRLKLPLSNLVLPFAKLMQRPAEKS